MRLRALLPLAVLTSAALAQPALAQTSPAQIEAAKKAAAEAADKALDAYEAGKYADAIAGFQTADKAFHAPKFQLYVARAQARMGKLVAAKATYEAIIKEQLPAFAPAEFFTAQADAKKELAELSPRIPTLLVQVKGGLQTVTLDGKPFPAGKAVSVDPGEHSLVATGSGVAEARLQITVQEREKKEAVLEPPATTPQPVPSATATGTEPPPDAPSGSGGPFSRMPVPTVVAYGAAAVGLVVGGIFSGLTLAKKGEYDTLRNAEELDPTRVNDAARQGRAFSVVADVGFIVAIAGAAAGTIVWVVSPKPKEGSATGNRVFVAPYAGGMTVGGSF